MRTTIVNVALDKLASDLHAPLSTVQWVSGYLLSLAVVIPLSGTGSSSVRGRPMRSWPACSSLRGVGLGCTVQPAMASAYTLLRPE